MAIPPCPTFHTQATYTLTLGCELEQARAAHLGLEVVLRVSASVGITVMAGDEAGPVPEAELSLKVAC